MSTAGSPLKKQIRQPASADRFKDAFEDNEDLRGQTKQAECARSNATLLRTRPRASICLRQRAKNAIEWLSNEKPERESATLPVPLLTDRPT